MKKKLPLFIAFVLFTTLSFGQNKLWTKISDEKLKGLEKMERAVSPSVYEIMKLDFNVFKQS